MIIEALYLSTILRYFLLDNFHFIVLYTFTASERGMLYILLQNVNIHTLLHIHNNKISTNK